MEEEQKNSGSDTPEKVSPAGTGRPRRSQDGRKMPGFDFGKLLLGVIVISFGFFLLGKNTGYVPQDIDINIFQFWPVLIIALGLSFLDTRRPLFFLVALLIFMAAAATIGTVVIDQINEGHSDGRRQDQPINIERDREAELVRLDIQADLADLDVGGVTDKAVEGDFHSGYALLEANSRISDRVQEIELGTRNPDGWNPLLDNRGSDMDLRLGTGFPLEFLLDINATEADVDLREITAPSVTLDADASDVEILLSDKSDQVKVEVKADASRVRVVVPQSLGVRLILDSSASSESLAGFEKVGETEYRSSGYDMASKKAEMNVTINASDFKIERL